MEAAKDCEQVRLARLITLTNESCTQLVNSLPPETHQAVHTLLADPSEGKVQMLNAWRFCAQRDLEHGRAVDLAATAKRVETPFGVACLVAYAKAYVEAAETRLAGIGPGGV